MPTARLCIVLDFLNQIKTQMKNKLHILIALLPSYFGYMFDVAAAFIIIMCTLFLSVYTSMCVENEPYTGAGNDNKTMWFVHIVGTMILTALIQL
jgi:phosphatidylglycerophosphate synthase